MKTIRPCHSIHCRHYDLADGKMCEVEAERIREDLRYRAAKALDLTHSVGERGPKTYMARKRLALALDSKGTILIADIRWLEGLSNA